MAKIAPKMVQRNSPKAPAAPLPDRRHWLPLTVVGGLALVATGLVFARGGSAPATAAPSVPPKQEPAPPPAVKPAQAAELQPIRPEELAKAAPGPSGKLLVARGDLAKPTSFDGALQNDVQQMLDRAGVAYSAVVLMEPQTGKLLAMAESRVAGDPVGEIGSLTKPTVPAASVIKVVTAAALLSNRVSPDAKACFHGGLHGLDASHLREKPSDRRCETLTEALARSSNAAIARFALRDLPAGALLRTAEVFGFNRPLPSDVAFAPSQFAAGQTDMERAKAAAGFEGSNLSPLHAAWIASVVASDGQVARIRAWDPAAGLGDTAQESPGEAGQPDRATMETLRRMMVATTEIGTGRHAFAHRPRSLKDVAVGGKTGSLSAPEGELFRHVSWFVGFAPADRPRVAVAALAINGWKWKVKAPVLARDALGIFFDRATAKAAQLGSESAQGGLDASSASL